jgi:hypothetical protein
MFYLQLLPFWFLIPLGCSLSATRGLKRAAVQVVAAVTPELSETEWLTTP